jgi:hypothetical protein
MVDDVIECRVIKDEVIYIIEGTVHDVGINLSTKNYVTDS